MKDHPICHKNMVSQDSLCGQRFSYIEMDDFLPENSGPSRQVASQDSFHCTDMQDHLPGMCSL